MWSSSGDDAKVYMIHQNFLLKIVNIFSALPSTKVEEQVYIEVKCRGLLFFSNLSISKSSFIILAKFKVLQVL